MAIFNYYRRPGGSMIRRNVKTRFLILLFPFFPLLSLANNKESINLAADNIKYEYKKGIVNYKGHVKGNQGATELQANSMIVYYDQHHEIREINALGYPAQYKTLVHQDKDRLIAKADQITYYPQTGKVTLKGHAVVNYNNSVVTGSTIFYDIKNQVVTSHPKKDSQTQIVLEPIKNLSK